MNIHFTKPKKIDMLAYSCQLYQAVDNKKKVVKKVYSNVLFLGMHRENIFLFKQNELRDFMEDLDEHIIQQVKQNYKDWFVSNMDPQLIDEYFSNNLLFKKPFGDIVKLQCNTIFDEHVLKSNQQYTMTLTFKNLIFLKQKFYLECSISNVQECENFAISDSKSDGCISDEFPEPSHEDIMSMKTDYIDAKKHNIKNLENEISLLYDSVKKMTNTSKYIDVFNLLQQ